METCQVWAFTVNSNVLKVSQRMMVMDTGQVVFRHFQPDEDIPRLLNLRLAVEAEDQEGADNREENLRAQLTLFGHDPTRDRTVAFLAAAPALLLRSHLSRLPSATP